MDLDDEELLATRRMNGSDRIREEIKKENKAIEHILLDYKRALKENEELKKSKITYEAVRDIQEKNRNIVDNNYISKQKVKDKIEKLEAQHKIALEENSTKAFILKCQITILQELLKESED